MPDAHRKERNWRSGTRVRIVAPGHSFNGRLGTVERDTASPGGLLIVRGDNGKRHPLATSEAARLRDQTR